MRHARAFVSLSAVFVLVLVIAAIAPASTSRADKDIVQTATAAGKFKTLTSLLKQAGLVKTLKGKGPYTVFAPTDAAFAKVPKATLDEVAASKKTLRSVLLLHVAAGKLTAGKLVKRESIKTLNGQRLGVRVRKGKVFVGGARVLTPDVKASNGVIHVIGKVLLPR
jgi:uncharacterized surface protein with fasciclin (FAS1) repeats